MTMKIKCYDCGLEGDANTFVSTGWQNGPTPGQTMQFWCPQCTHANPKLGPATLWQGDKVPWPNPKWELVETSQGVCICANRCTSPMVSGHQLENAPASLLRPELEGTINDHSKRLQLDGKARSAAFHAENDAWQAANPEPSRNTHAHINWQEASMAAMDKAREENGVGPHYTRVAHNGPMLMQKGRSLRLVA
jgi:hypothetical protein